MRRRSTLLATAALLAWTGAAGSASADTTTIAIPGKYFDPARSTVVAGDTIRFRNDDVVTHNVRIAGGVFDSGPLARFTSWSQQIAQPGGYPFVCTLHAFMGGYLDVVAATLGTAPDGVIAGEPLTLSGRTAAGTAHVDVEQSVAGGDWTAVGDGAAPGADGSFTATVPAVEGASYRVNTPAGPGQVVTPRITAHVDVHLQVQRRWLHVHTMPATTGFIATLQLYSRWHYRWRSVRGVRLDGHGGAMFRLPPARRTYARVVLRRNAGGPALLRSQVVNLRSGRPARDPDAIAPAMPGGHGH